MKTTVIYHSADFDGIFCREIARKFLPPDTEFIGWNFGDPATYIPLEGTIYILDLPCDAPFGWKFDAAKPEAVGWQVPIGFWRRVLWIDHHATSIASHPTDIHGYRIDGVAACRLVWQWFATYNNRRNPLAESDKTLPTKQNFIDHKVTEPMAVRLAGEYDIWDRRDPNAELFQHGLRAQKLTPKLWHELLGGRPEYPSGSPTVIKLLERGAALQYAKTQENADIITTAGFDLHWEGLNFLACNHARFNSHLFSDALRPEHDALLGFAWRKDKWTVSLYHAPGHEHHDLSAIAKRYNGGGHKGACGFTCTELPFKLS